MSDRYHYAYAPQNCLGRRSLYLNWGLWDDDTAELDDAAVSLILEVGRRAGLGPDTRLLDVGFGFGDQLLDWCGHLALGHADGLNISSDQTATARDRIAAAGMGDRVQLHVGTAVDLPFAAGSFDAVTAVECAFHFPSRDAFFREAHRVLAPGGRIALADFIGAERPTALQRTAERVAAWLWGFDLAGQWTTARYREHLRAAGFTDVEIDVVTERVVDPGRAWARRRIWDRDLRDRMELRPWLTTVIVLAVSWLLGDPVPGQYILVKAARGAGPVALDPGEDGVAVSA